MKFLTIKPVSLLFTGALLIVSQIAGAQTDIRNLTAIGANATQASVGRFINDWLTDPLNAGFENGSEEEQEIWDICTDYADQASTASTQDELASALTLLDYVANEEVAAVGSGLTDTGHDQVASVLGRLQTLRSGTPALASLNGVSLLSGGAAGADFSKLSYFANASYGDGEKDRTRNEQGFDFDVIETALAHTGSNEVRNAYNRADYIERRKKLMNWWSEHIENAAIGNMSLTGKKGPKLANS